MLGAVQFGVVAACVVLFVPMGMAGWHLSRNKMLFFSGALFITLAVGVHLAPYFPSITHFVYSVSSPAVTINRGSCMSYLHNIVYDLRQPNSAIEGLNYNSSSDGSLGNGMSWEWAKSESVIACGFQKLEQSVASNLLNGSWIAVAGDSQARLFALALLNLVLDSDRMDSVRHDLFKRHSDYQIASGEIGMRLDFIWAPYVTNLTDLMVKYRHTDNYPDVLVLGSGLWHMLHITNASDYGATLGLLRKAMQLPVPSIRLQHLFWLGMPMLINTMLNTEEKKWKMNGVMQHAYNSELYKSKILYGFDGSVFLLDIYSLSRKCGVICAVDGMHYHGAVYEATVHIMLNALLIESDQIL